MHRITVPAHPRIPGSRGPAIVRHVAAVLLLSAGVMLQTLPAQQKPVDLDRTVSLLVHGLRMRIPTPLPDTAMTLEQGYEVQARVLAELASEWGAVAGYKLALTNEVLRRRFRAQAPVFGVLHASGLLTSGAGVPVTYAAFPQAEADLLLRVGSDAINDARTDDELSAAISAIVPAIELVDLVYVNSAYMRVPALAAANAGASRMVLGPDIRVRSVAALRSALESIAVEVTRTEARKGRRAPVQERIARGGVTSITGGAIAAVRQLRDEAHARGYRLKPGDLLSIGSLTPMIPAKPGETLRVSMTGIPGGRSARVSVTFQ